MRMNSEKLLTVFGKIWSTGVKKRLGKIYISKHILKSSDLLFDLCMKRAKINE